MKKLATWGLALGLSLTGCAGLPTGLTGTSAVDALVADTVAATQAGADMNLASGYAQDTRFSVQALEIAAKDSAEAEATGSGKIAPPQGPHFGDRMQKRHGDVHNLVRETLQNPDGYASGSVMVKTTLTLNNRAGNQTHVDERVTLDGALIAQINDFTQSNAKGHAMAMHRSRIQNVDGTWTETFHGVITRRDGKTKTIDWTKTTSADGSESGSGTITRFDGTVITLKLSRAADGSVSTDATDSGAQVTATVRQDEDGTQASVTVTDSQSGQVTATTTVTDTEAVEPSDK